MLPLRPQMRVNPLSNSIFSHGRCPYRSRNAFFRLSSTAQPTSKRRSLRPYIYAATFLAVGALIGTAATAVIRPPPFPPPGSETDAKLLSQLAKEIDNLPIVKSLRRGSHNRKDNVTESLHKDTTVSKKVADVLDSGTADDDAEDAWIELLVSYESSNTMLNGLSGFGRMGIQRAFWQPATKEIVMIIWYGGALCGWPGIAHGGCTATFSIEGLGKAVNCVRQLDSSNGDTTSTPPDPSSLSLTYLRPVNANAIYVLRAQMAEQDISSETSLPPQKDLTKKHRNEKSGITHLLNKKYEVHGTIENMEGKVCVKAIATWDIL